MFKTVFFLHRRSDFSPEAFRRYSDEVHVPLVSRVPGLERYVVNHTLLNPAGAAGACDAVAELWFASPDVFQQALGSAEGAAALSDQHNYLDMERTHVLFMEEVAVI
ncbi:MAG: EthD family reductase [Gemmatimonadaceae bacterium]